MTPMDVPLRRAPDTIYGFAERTAGTDRVDCYVYAEEDGITVPLDAADDYDDPLERTRLLLDSGTTTYDDAAPDIIDDILTEQGVDGAEDWARFTADIADDVTGGYVSSLRDTLATVYRQVRDESPSFDVHVGTRDRDFPLVWEAVETDRGRAGRERYLPGVAQLHALRQYRRARTRRRALTEEGFQERYLFAREVSYVTTRFLSDTGATTAVGVAGLMTGGDFGTAVALAAFGLAMGPIPGRAADGYADALADGDHVVDWPEVKPYLRATRAD